MTIRSDLQARSPRRAGSALRLKLLRVAALVLTVCLLGLFVFPSAARAGQNCRAQPPDLALVKRAMDLAAQTSDALDASGQQVVVLARAGQDLTAYGLHYSHLAFAIRTPEGPWRVVHKLNQCGTAVGAVYRQGLGEFFMDDLWRYEAAWVVPAAPVQAQLATLLQSVPRTLALHWAPYSVVSYSWGQTYQQSNQWALETLASAMEPGITDRGRAQAWLRFKGFEPTTLAIGPLARLGGRVGSANVAFDDHPTARRFSNRIDTTTVESAFAWLTWSGLAGPVQKLRADQANL